MQNHPSYVRTYEQDPVQAEGRGQGRLPVGGEASSVWSHSLAFPGLEKSKFPQWDDMPRRQGLSAGSADLSFLC